MAPSGNSCGGRAALIAALLLATPQPGRAEDRWPDFLAEIAVELEDEWILRSDDPEEELNDAFATVDAELTLALPAAARLHATAVFEPVTDPEGDRFFEDFGLLLEEIYIARPVGRAELLVGKFSPVFGAANDLAPGLYGDELAGDYELTERIGLAAALPVEAAGGEHLLTAAVFVADRTQLSGALFTGRDRLRRGDGGVSNTALPGSFALAGTGEVGGTGYTFGLRYQRAGSGDETDKYGAVLGLVRELELGPAELALFGEAAHFPQFDGAPDRATILTLAAEVGMGAWAASAALGLRNGADAPTDRLATATLERALGERLTLAAGYRYLEEDGAHSHALGLRLSYEFSLP